jgi:nucleoside-diphosphate-sugar epimerase
MKEVVLCDPNKRVLVTGATGFIGSNLVFSLIRRGHTVGILTRTSSDMQKLEAVKNTITVFKSDTYADIYTCMKIFSPGIVIHTAALVNQQSPQQIVDLIYANVTFGTHILEAMLENKVIRFLNIGTRWQHIGNKRYCPANLYAATKEAFKDILIYYGTRGIKHKTIELCDTFGFGDTRMKILDLLIVACQKHKQLDLTPGEQIIDLSFIDDICQFVLSKMRFNKFFDNKTISLSGKVIKLRNLGQLIEQKYNAMGVLNWGAKPYRVCEVMTPPIYYKKMQLDQGSLERYLDSLKDSR